MEEIKVGSLEPRLQKGFKVDYGKVKKAIEKCEADKNKAECKKTFADLGIEVYD